MSKRKVVTMQKKLTVLSMVLFSTAACDEPVAEEVEFRDYPVCAQYNATLNTINFNRELLITDTAVVNDACRTAWNGINCNTTLGKWTAWHLFSQFDGDSTTSELIHRFYETFDSGKVINGTALEVRTKARNYLKDWRRVSGCEVPGQNGAPDPINWDSQWIDLNNQPKNGNCLLDKTKAPFRLLAIVNRMDVRAPLGGNGYYQGKPGDAGEGRFVFGFLGYKKAPDMVHPNIDPNIPSTWVPDIPLDATVIFEYRLPPKLNNSVMTWAQNWHALAALPPSDPNYRTKLQTMTDLFTKEAAETANIFNPVNEGNNYSALARIRTNELAFAKVVNTGVWSMREYTLQCLQPNCGINKRYLVPKFVPMSPNRSFNTEHFDLFQTYMSDNKGLILSMSHEVPDTLGGFPFLGAEALANPFSVNPAGVLWGYDQNNDQVIDIGNNGFRARHLFGFMTCMGCHYNETDTQNLFIKNRQANVSSGLADFLKTPVLDPPGTFEVSIEPFSNDPNYSYGDWHINFNEPRRRACESLHAMAGNSVPITKPNG